jgi:hypothetical protein
MTVLGIVALVFSLFYSELADEPLQWGQSPVVLAVGWLLVAVQVVLVVWSLAIFLKGVAVVQGFSIGRAMLNALLAWSAAAAILALVTVGLGLSDSLNWLFFAGADELVEIHAPE